MIQLIAIALTAFGLVKTVATQAWVTVARLTKRSWASIKALDLRIESAGLLAGVVALQLAIPTNGLSGKVPEDVSEARSITAPIQKIEEPKTGLPEIEPFPEPKVTKTMTVSATAYNSLPEQTDGDPFTTAAGTRTRPGVIAGCFPFGTQLEIIVPGQDSSYKGLIYTVEDRTAKNHCNHIDIWMETYAEAKQWGRRTVEIRIIEPVDYSTL